MPFPVISIFPEANANAEAERPKIGIIKDSAFQFYYPENLDALAASGIHFTEAYAAAAVCSPTRASILTGLYPARIGITAPVCHLPEERLGAKLVTT